MSVADHIGRCNPHVKGVPLGAPPFFYENCYVCAQKLAEGKVRGDEGPLPKMGWRTRAANTSPKKLEDKAARARAGRAAARKAWL